MRYRLTLLALAMSILPIAAGAQVRIDEDFETGSLDEDLWCPCQIDMKDSPVTFPDDPDEKGDFVARIAVDEAALGGNVCHWESECKSVAMTMTMVGAEFLTPDLSESLGLALGTLPAPYQLRSATPNPHCDEAVWERVRAAKEENECTQRQELRFLTATHPVDMAHTYSFRFRITGEVKDRNHIRWITAQWKQEPISSSYGRNPDPSPFLAQRFVDGVLYVTVQDEFCQCVVASSKGKAEDWTSGEVKGCTSTRRGEDGKKCPSPLYVRYGDNPVLTSPSENWTAMTYRVEASRAREARIVVEQDGRSIVEVRGRIGYRPRLGMRSVTKFKIGHYRDYMPDEHAMEIDWLHVSPGP